MEASFSTVNAEIGFSHRFVYTLRYHLKHDRLNAGKTLVNKACLNITAMANSSNYSGTSI